MNAIGKRWMHRRSIKIPTFNFEGLELSPQTKSICLATVFELQIATTKSSTRPSVIPRR